MIATAVVVDIWKCHHACDDVWLFFHWSLRLPDMCGDQRREWNDVACACRRVSVCEQASCVMTCGPVLLGTAMIMWRRSQRAWVSVGGCSSWESITESRCPARAQFGNDPDGAEVVECRRWHCDA